MLNKLRGVDVSTAAVGVEDISLNVTGSFHDEYTLGGEREALFFFFAAQFVATLHPHHGEHHRQYGNGRSPFVQALQVL